MVNLAFVKTFFSIEIVDLPGTTVFGYQRASQQFLIPFIALVALTFVALPSGSVEDWHLRRTLAGIVGSNVLHARLALLDALACSEVIELRSVLALHRLGDAFEQVLVPLLPSRTSWSLANSRGLIEDRLLGEAFTGIVIFVIRVVGFAFRHASLILKDVDLLFSAIP